MGKGRNKQQFFAVAQDRTRKLKEELTATNTKYNLLQQKHNELKRAHSVALKRIKVQAGIIAELEEQLSLNQKRGV